MGLQSIASGLGISLSLTMRTDATAAIGICKRLGVGKIRHLDTARLWVQQRVRNGDVRLKKVAGADNPSGCRTKYLLGPDL